MKNAYKITLLAACLLLVQAISAQSEGFDRAARRTSDQLEAKATPKVRGGTADSEIKIQKPDGYPAKDIPKEYNGFRIEIMVSDSLLAADDDLFFKHGNILLEPLSDSRFAYTVGDFQDAESAAGFMQQFILPKYSEARVVSYKDGKRN